MLIKKIRLENIRSYLNQEIELPEGSVLLSGNVGSGKSSVLLAIDFALFGFSEQGAGSSLLRHGKNKGSIELFFEVDGKEFILKRSLKRNTKGVKQEAGYLFFDGIKKELTSSELKARVLELLNYPKELLTKSKNLIYRYTVYTPQEEMKQILLSDKDERLEILRKVFDIDKYKRIRDNTEIFTRNLRRKIAELQGMLIDLREKQEEKLAKEIELNNIEQYLNKTNTQLSEIRLEIESSKKNLSLIETKIKKLNELKNELNTKSLALGYKIENKERNNKLLLDIEKEIKKIEEEKLPEINKKLLLKKKQEIENHLEDIELKIKQINNKLTQLDVKKQQSLDLKNKILTMDKCPTCYQDITLIYKENIIKNENSKLEKIEQELTKNLDIHEQLEQALTQTKKQNKDLDSSINKLEILELKLNNLKEKKQLKEALLKEQSTLDIEIKKLNEESSYLKIETSNYQQFEEKFEILKNNHEEILKKQRNIEIQKATFEENKRNLRNSIKKLTEEVNKKLLAKKNLENLQQINTWLEEHFLNLMSVMEKSIMIKLHSDFNSLFENWFNIIIDNENINVRLDEEFTPIIEQDGYETDYLHLSGGEKTAVALAYRLSLNQIINNLVANIKTKDLIILDEPTDGFSSEQLDRVKLVLDELNVKQVIIVSHESKIESFVDNILKFEKINNVSKITPI